MFFYRLFMNIILYNGKRNDSKKDEGSGEEEGFSHFPGLNMYLWKKFQTIGFLLLFFFLKIRWIINSWSDI